MRKKGNLSIFVPHLGCPHQCSFCNQNVITHTQKQPTAETVNSLCKALLQESKPEDFTCEIAFFGGSFTAIPFQQMISLLQAASPFLQERIFSGIRISTRPDCVEDAMLNILKQYGVTSIELGAQSMDDDVLRENLRGHTAQDVIEASQRIQKWGFSLGLQMMTGLYGDTPEKSWETARKIVDLSPDTVRIYPTVVLRGTYLAEKMQSGCYSPPDVETSVPLCAELLQMFMERGISVIRMGLHAEENVESQMIGGAYHPAFRDLCEGELFLKKAIKMLQQYPREDRITVLVNPSAVSKMIGQNKRNIIQLSKLGYHVRVQGSSELETFEIKTLQE